MTNHKKKPINYTRYKIRKCLYLNECAVCKQRITSGQRYYDGGDGRRAHKECAEAGVRDAGEVEDETR